MATSFFRYIIILTAFFGQLSNYLYASEDPSGISTLKLVTPAWKNFTEEDGKGFYFDLIKMVYEPRGISVIYEIMPWARCEILLRQRKADALVGSYKEKTTLFHYPSKPVWLDTSAAVFKKNKFEWQGIESLENRNVGWIRGYAYDAYLKTNSKIFRLNDNRQGWSMLTLGRIDFYIDSRTDLQFYIEENGLKQSDYAIENVLTKEMFLRFSISPKGFKLANIYDQQIVKLEKSGQLKALYSKWGLDKHYPEFERLF